MADAPCFKCRNRHMGCHGECDDYHEWVIATEIIKERNAPHPADRFTTECKIRNRWFANQKRVPRLGAQV